MTRYEGLSLPELLALMHELVLPEPVAWTPQTIGWTVVGAWLLVVAILLAWHRIQVWRRNRYRREALAELQRISSSQQLDPQSMATAIAVLLKRTALAAYSREQVGKLCGSEWAQFLVQSAANDRLVADSAAALGSAAYSRDANGKELIEPARRWIQVHRV